MYILGEPHLRKDAEGTRNTNPRRIQPDSKHKAFGTIWCFCQIHIRSDPKTIRKCSCTQLWVSFFYCYSNAGNFHSKLNTKQMINWFSFFLFQIYPKNLYFQDKLLRTTLGNFVCTYIIAILYDSHQHVKIWNHM